MTQRISGRDVEARLQTGTRILFEQVNINLDDGIAATNSQGYPHGWVHGEVKGDGDIELTTEMLLLLNEEAESAGSWEEMEPFDITFFANVGSQEFEVKAFGVKLRMPSFSFDGAGGEQITHAINFVISSPDFVHLNGVPLARRVI